MFQSFRVTSVCQLVVRAADRRWSVAVRWRGDGAEHISGGIITQTAAASELQSAQWSRAAGSESALMTELSEDQFVWFLLKTFWTDLVEICPPRADWFDFCSDLFLGCCCGGKDGFSFNQYSRVSPGVWIQSNHSSCVAMCNSFHEKPVKQLLKISSFPS